MVTRWFEEFFGVMLGDTLLMCMSFVTFLLMCICVIKLAERIFIR